MNFKHATEPTILLQCYSKVSVVWNLDGAKRAPCGARDTQISLSMAGLNGILAPGLMALPLPYSGTLAKPTIGNS